MHFARGSCPRSGSGARATAMMSGLELSEGFTGNWNCRKRLHVQRAFIRTKQNRLEQRKIPARRDIGLRSYRQLSEFLTNSLPSGTGVRVESLPPGAFFPSFRPARKGQPTGGKSKKENQHETSPLNSDSYGDCLLCAFTANPSSRSTKLTRSASSPHKQHGGWGPRPCGRNRDIQLGVWFLRAPKQRRGQLQHRCRRWRAAKQHRG